MDELFLDLFNIRPNRKKVRVGDVLIAEPFLEGKHFFRSVIYMVEHDEKGSVGFVLNKLTSYNTSDLVQEMEGFCFPIYAGGPLDQDHLYYLHTHAEIRDALLIADGIYWGGDFGQLVSSMKEGDIFPGEICFFIGYCGWGAGQLKKELNENSWMVGRITAQRFFDISKDELWKLSMEELGGKHKIWANFPEDPTMN